MDTLTRAQRSDRMSRIRGKDTSPELWVRRYLHSRGFRYRLHGTGLPGRPDLVLPKHGAVVFVHGCFWHAHSCQKGRIPATRSEFWLEKFEANQTRDIRNERALRRLGWRVLTIWECSLTTAAKRDRALANLEAKLVGHAKARIRTR
jgi:DNA mismatch endonuclease (patch repair protein)